jgi:1-acyl-sn-glycerol-3-phosphate acyltransferase
VNVHVPSLLRRRLWRIACSLAGGLTVTGRWPAPRDDGRGRILVANHSSHGDTAAIMAALPVPARPVFAAAADYWFDVPVRRLLVTGLAGALPVRRTEAGAYAALLEAARPALEAGRTVVVYPEGTRTQDGSVGTFHSGAVRLAVDCDVPVVPVAILGTRELLPKNGHFTPTPMEVRIGQPVEPADADAARLRDEVAGMLAESPVRPRTSRVWTAVARLVSSPWGLALAFVWGLAEALSWPIMAEMALVLLAAAVPRRVWAWAAAIVAGSVMGVVTNAALASGGTTLPQPLTTARMRDVAADHLAGGASGIWHQALNGIPVKVYAEIAGRLDVPLPSLAGWALLERGLRMAVAALVVWALARVLHPWLRRLYGPYLVAVAAGFAAILSLILAGWS